MLSNFNLLVQIEVVNLIFEKFFRLLPNERTLKKYREGEKGC